MNAFIPSLTTFRPLPGLTPQQEALNNLSCSIRVVQTLNLPARLIQAQLPATSDTYLACAIYLTGHGEEPELRPAVTEIHDASNALDVVDGFDTPVSKYSKVVRNTRHRHPSSRAGRWNRTRQLGWALD